MKKILLVEDDLSLRKQILFAIEKNFNVYEAHNRKKAINVLKKSDIDIIMLDLGLPPSEDTPIEGLLLLDYILNNLNTKVIVLTGQKTEKTAIDSIKKGAFDYILKPVDMEKLIISIERAVLFVDIEQKMDKEGVKKLNLMIKTGDGLQSLREEAQKSLIKQVLQETDFNIYRSAKTLGIKRENLYYFIKKFNWKRNNDI